MQVVPCGTFLSALSCLILNDSSAVRVLFDLMLSLAGCCLLCWFGGDFWVILVTFVHEKKQKLMIGVFFLLYD